MSVPCHTSEETTQHITEMGISRGLTRKDGPFSWLVAVAMSVCLFIEGGLIFTGGIFLVVFLNVFNEDRGKTALISSMNHGTLCFICMYDPEHTFISRMHLETKYIFG